MAEGAVGVENDQASLGEQALSKAVEIGLSTQLDEVETLDVDIRTDPLKLMQGEVDSVAIEGEGMVMQQDLRMAEMSLQTDHISINPLAAAFGKIELARPTQAEAHVVLREADINRAFNSDYIREKLGNLQIPVQGQPMTVNTQEVQFGLPGEGKVRLQAQIHLQETGETSQVAFTAVPRQQAAGQQIVLENVEYAEGQGLAPELTDALLEQATELLDLRNFELEGVSLRLKTLDVQIGQLILQAEASVEKFPAA